MFEVKLQQFSGPLSKLLELIEEKKLEITEVNLAQVTGDFIAYLQDVKDRLDANVLADFLVVASKLLLIKSKTLLPDLPLSEEEEHEIFDLESRLTIYREFASRIGMKNDGQQSASSYLYDLWNKKLIAFSRPLLFAIDAEHVFYPAPNLSVESLVNSLRSLTATIQEWLPETSKIREKIISLEEKIQELMSRFKEAITHTFSSLISRKSKSEAIVLFLAVLHLLRQKTISVEQQDRFGDIIIKRAASD